MMSADIPHASPVLAQVDKLIDYYESHRPDAGQRIAVYVTPLQLARILSYPMPAVFPPGYKVPAEFNYRGRILFCALGDRT